MTSLTRLFSAFVFVACLLTPLLVAAVPVELAHHGTLYNTAGEPVTGSVEVTFSLWDAEETGAQVWFEVRTVDVVDGVYSTLLGSETAVEAVLKTEPALWLQMSIGGEALVPRHPVASVPYAIVAETAVNVDGGTVNATSVSVGGTEVIDATGSWTGGAGSIGWSALTGAPADADTLGGLSCADGDRAVWNDGSQLWECGTSTVTLDRLDTAAATTGQILTYDGADAAWEDAGSSAGGCVVSGSTTGAVTLDCGGTQYRLVIEEEYIGLIDWQTRLRADGTLKDYTGVAPSGVFASVFGNDQTRCAIDAAGATTCWTDSASSVAVQPPAGSYQTGSCGNDYACCAVTLAGAIVCWDPVLGSTSYQVFSGIPSGTFAEVAVYNSVEGCALSTTGSVHCWGGVTGFQANRPLGTGFDKISQSGNMFCAGGPSGGACWTSASTNNWYTVPAGNYIQMFDTFGLLATGEVLDFSTAGGLRVSPDLFTAIGTVANSPGVTIDGRLAPLNGRGPQWPGP